MAPPTNRYAHSRAILGDELFAKVHNSRVLVVGAGGIGCELIKNMVMTGFGGGANALIQVLDLDTIDLSNLNRQFLFQKQHVKRPKAVVARETALKFNPNVHIEALHRNIKDAEYSVDYFKSFDFVMNALDNLGQNSILSSQHLWHIILIETSLSCADARRHVNKMCLAADVPLIESGTSGYTGQVQPIKKDQTECYDCTAKPVPKTFAVCTIRSTPSTAHHCIAWAKSYLFPQLYGADDEAEGQELDDAEKNGENAEEIQELRKEAAAIKQLRGSLAEPGAAKRVFDKVYSQDINRLLKMEDMWKHRKPPHPLSWDELSASTSTSTSTSTSADAATESTATPSATNGSTGGLIKDQRTLSLRDSFNLFISSIERLSSRISPTSPLSFDKDDDDTLDFVVACANLRASCFNIESQTRFQVKEYAGNIIPAIATTNAIIAGVLVLQALNVLRNDWVTAKMVYLSRNSGRVFNPIELLVPNEHCSICRTVYVPIHAKASATLGEFVTQLVEKELGWKGFVSIAQGSRVLYEREDFEDNEDKTLVELGVGEGSFLTVMEDEEEPQPWPVVFSIGSSLSDEVSETFKVDGEIPSPIPRKAPKPIAKEDLDDAQKDDDDEFIITEVDATTTTTKKKGVKRTAVEADLEGDEKTQSKVQKVVEGGEVEEEVLVLDD
ncbi:BZ3500_MvSof-1268-A1-R1_Chr4-1g06683 [Microbotryum saponariae]|uniref:Ubiquitin-activating enzyme E1-like n=1 Tax=Microbotryum saponariae TaxID=289078 RepID=A0A2X0MQY7_9BASI|nr:BZ3500_MvSof-1268-A1-R1_Chr4-1g06683 [Microbotryum saponariae]SDA06348.1 BZ3501_MvSof-1269-A2-R1_Chr4-1g06393 [Microbotryum saponariae]